MTGSGARPTSLVRRRIAAAAAGLLVAIALAVPADASAAAGRGPALHPAAPLDLGTTFAVGRIHVVDLPTDERFYTLPALPPLNAPPPVDPNGVPLYQRNGRLYYHPVMLAQRALDLLDGYRRTNDPRYLTGARAVADAIVAHSTLVKGARYPRFDFDFRLHNLADAPMTAPWYSGMANGMALSVFSRLHAIDGRPADLEIARTFVAGFIPRGRAKPWISQVKDGYYWIQEYPAAVPDDTLNGFIFALFGLYDYVQETHDADAQRYLLGGLTTVLHVLPAFRNPGHVSYYCLAHHVQNLKYHQIHVAQLTMLARMTESPVFARWAARFDADA
jgi:hypothetical protein